MDDTSVRLGLSDGDRRFVLIGFPVIGAVIALLLPLLWSWVGDQEWLPLRGPIDLLLSLDHGWQSVVRVALLAAVGLVLALITLGEDTVVTIDADTVRVAQGDTSRTITRDQIAGVRLEGKLLVIETAQGRRLLEREVEGAKRKAGPAFRRFDYPWEND